MRVNSRLPEATDNGSHDVSSDEHDLSRSHDRRYLSDCRVSENLRIADVQRRERRVLTRRAQTHALLLQP